MSKFVQFYGFSMLKIHNIRHIVHRSGNQRDKLKQNNLVRSVYTFSGKMDGSKRFAIINSKKDFQLLKQLLIYPFRLSKLSNAESVQL